VFNWAEVQSALTTKVAPRCGIVTPPPKGKDPPCQVGDAPQEGVDGGWALEVRLEAKVLGVGDHGWYTRLV